MIKRRKKSLTIKKRSIAINGHKTSLNLEDEFWKSLQMIADDLDETLPQLVARMPTDGLSISRRLSGSLLLFICAMATESDWRTEWSSEQLARSRAVGGTSGFGKQDSNLQTLYDQRFGHRTIVSVISLPK